MCKCNEVVGFGSPSSVGSSAKKESSPSVVLQRRRRTVNRQRILVAIVCPFLSDIVVSSSSYSRRDDLALHYFSSSAPPNFSARSSASVGAPSSGRRPPSIPSLSATDDSAFIYSLLKRRRKNNGQADPGSALIVDKVNGDTENTLIKNGVVNGNTIGANGHHIKYNLGDKRNGQHQQQEQQYLVHDQLRGVDVVEDEPYATMHDAYSTYSTLSEKYYEEEKVRKEVAAASASAAAAAQPEQESTNLGKTSESFYSSLDSMEGSSDEGVYYIRAAKYVRPTKKNDPINETASQDVNIGVDEDKVSMWAKRNARSIDEGIRFKSQLREGLEEQTKLHRERLLSNLMEGVIGGTTKALEFDKAKIKNATNPFRWLGFGRGDNDKDSLDAEEDVTTAISGAASLSESTLVDMDDVSSEVISSGNTEEMEAPSKKKDKSASKSSKGNRKFGARTIAGLIMALAEEVEGLEVEVDADADTPIWNKSVHSIKICFSRLGFKQLRMGGLDEVFEELESSMSPSEKFALAKSFLKNVGGKPTTADEAFDKIDVDNSGALDEEELSQALKMAAIIGGNKFGTKSKETLTELASRLVRLYDTNGDGVVDREEYQAMVQDMAALRDARLREEMHDQTELGGEGQEKKRGWLSNIFGNKNQSMTSDNNSTATAMDGNGNVVDVTENEEFWGSMDQGEGSLVLEDLKLDLRRLLFGAIPGVKRVLPGGPLILKPFTATLTASFNKDDIMDSFLLDSGLRRLVARALSRRVRGIRDLLDGAVFYGRTWKMFQQNAPQVEVAKLEDVQFDRRNRLVITGRAKIKEALGYRHTPIEQGFKVRTKIGTRNNGRIIGLLEPEIAIFAECPKEVESTARTKCKEWFGYTIPTFKPLYFYIPLVSPLKKNDKMDGFNMGEDNQIKSIDIKNGKLRLEFSAFLRPGRFLGNHYLAFTVPNRTLILTLDRVREGMRNARRNKRLAELAAREVQDLEESFSGADPDMKPVISPEGKVRIRRLEKELKATIQEEAILREIEESNKENENGKSFISRFVEGYSGAIREELDLEMNARLSSSISDFFGSQGSDGEETKEYEEF